MDSWPDPLLPSANLVVDSCLVSSCDEGLRPSRLVLFTFTAHQMCILASSGDDLSEFWCFIVGASNADRNSALLLPACKNCPPKHAR